MKILRLSLYNLNSLRGEHQVDLSSEPLASAGIFAITGHTGAGKSTLLDAITLALYGRAARYGESPNPEDMMSRHTGECRAEVEFEVPGKSVYKAAWHLRRAKGKVDGKIQPAKRYLYDANGEVLAEKIKEVDTLITQLCGLDYHRFTRSVLLAQGEFAKFLKAKPDERAELLESLTQTSIYTELGLLVHEEVTRRRTQLEEAERTLSQVVLFTEKEVVDKQAELGRYETQITAQKQKRTQLNRELDHARQLADFSYKFKLHQAEQAKQVEYRKQVKGGLDRLVKHRLATPYFPQLARWEQAAAAVTLRKQKVEEHQQSRHKSQAQLLAALGAATELGNQLVAKHTDRLALSNKQIDQFTSERQTIKDWLGDNQLDAALGKALPELSSQLTILNRVRQRLSEFEPPTDYKDRQSAQQTVDTLRQSSDDSQREAELEQLQQRHNDLSRLEVQVGALDQRKTTLSELVEKLEQANQQKLEAEQPLADCKQRREVAEELVQSHRAHLRTIDQIASMAEHRSRLQSGEACPLCGSDSHPYLEEGAGEQLKANQIEAKLEAAKQSLQAGTKAEQQARDIYTKASTECEVLVTRNKNLKTEFEASRDQLSKLAEALKIELLPEAVTQAIELNNQQLKSGKLSLQQLGQASAAVVYYDQQQEIQQIERRLTEQLKSFSVGLPETGQEIPIYQSLEKRFDQYQKQEQKHDQLTEQIRKTNDQRDLLSRSIEQLRKDLAPILSERSKHPESAKPDSDLFGWSDLDTAKAAIQTFSEQNNSASVQLAEAEKELVAAEASAADHYQELSSRVDESDFQAVESLSQAKLSDTDYAKLTKLEKELEQSEQTLRGRLESTQESIDKLRQQNAVEGDAHRELEQVYKQIETVIDQQLKDSATIKTALEADEKNRQLYDTRTEVLLEQRSQLKTWGQLHGLIGDGRGKKFRVYAQGISLDLLIRQANRHLGRLTERYLLRRVQGVELDLEIEDRFQASVCRPMASLSGGESFLASLALALGLSDLAGRNVQIDSLFIDEGFGTLDSDTLEVAISALESLRQSNKTVGVISHVEILKERITTQISVEKLPDGTSQLILRK